MSSPVLRPQRLDIAVMYNTMGNATRAINCVSAENMAFLGGWKTRFFFERLGVDFKAREITSIFATD